MTEIIFSNKDSVNPALYVSPSGTGWCAYLLPRGSKYKSDTIKLSETWAEKGFYLFAQSPPGAKQGDFVKKAWDYFDAVIDKFTWISIVWMLDKDMSFSDNSVLIIQIQQSEINKFIIRKPVNFNIGNNFATLFFAESIQVKLEMELNQIRILNHFPKTITFNNNKLSCNTVIFDDLIIPFDSNPPGSMNFKIGLNEKSDFSGFQVHQKFFYKSNNGNDFIELCFPVFKEGDPNVLVLFQAKINPCDILNETCSSTYLIFTGQNYNDFTKQNFPTVLKTCFCTDLGYDIDIVPLITSDKKQVNNINGTGPKIVFSERKSGDKSLPYYMVPEGDFALHVENLPEQGTNKPQFLLLCGLSGLETISFTADDSQNINDVVCFHPDNPAYAVEFPFSTEKYIWDSSKVTEKLDKTFLTAWISIKKSDKGKDDIFYFSQPRGASLYKKDPDLSKLDPSFLGKCESKSAVLSRAVKEVIFPLAAYSGVRPEDEPVFKEYKNFEFQILNPVRKEKISSAEYLPLSKLEKNIHGKNLEDIWSTTPQGLLVQMEKSPLKPDSWKVLLLAKNKVKREIEGVFKDIEYSLEFDNLCVQLINTFQTDQLFLVISLNTKLKKSGDYILGDFKNEMFIEDWPFLINVPQENQSGVYKNVMIFKFCHGSLLDRVKNTKLWMNPADFNKTENSGLTGLSLWLQKYIQDGINSYINDRQQVLDPDFEKFYTVATDPEWNGILALKLDVDLMSFPEQLQGLIGGIDLSRFYIHHFGVDINQVKSEVNGDLSMIPKSSLFGLINYCDVTFEKYKENIDEYKKHITINTGTDYDFKVLNLKVLFENSKIKNFNSHIQLVLNRLFGDKVVSGNNDNVLIMNGNYENHDGFPVYIFNETGDNIINLQSSTLKRVEILKSNFNTLLPQSDKKKSQITSAVDPDKVHSRFSLWGYMNFNYVKNFDLFSFGSELDGKGVLVTDSQTGLSFSNLGINMDFDLSTPACKTFGFDISHMAFNIAQSTMRKDSLYAHFPLQVKTIIGGGAGNKLSDMDFLNVIIPDLESGGSISDNWYGLLFNLNMGTLGALAAEAGFNAEFLTVWQPGSASVAAYVKLPGVDTKSRFLSLQGILKVDIETIQLMKGKKYDGTGDAYLMKFNNIALKFLSKKFPPDANIYFFLFGNPEDNAPPGSLGWYAAYKHK